MMLYSVMIVHLLSTLIGGGGGAFDFFLGFLISAGAGVSHSTLA